MGAQSVVKVALAGVGNCASALVEGAAFYAADPDAPGLMTREIGPYGPGSVKVVAAFDVNERKVGADLHDAIRAEPNVPLGLFPLRPESGVIVRAGPRLDGVGRSLSRLIPRTTEGSADEVVEELIASEADVLVSYMPVGADQATRAYARAALRADVGFINAVPVKVANDPTLVAAFEERGLPLVGDDVKGQAGATILHRCLAQMLSDRGVRLERTYQTNHGGATGDFTNMNDDERLATKRWSKTRAVTDVANGGEGLDEGSIYVGPSGVIPFLGDEKIAHIYLGGAGFAGNQLEIEVRYRGGDSPNSGGVIYDAVRWVKWARDQAIGGLLEDVCAVYMKAPPSAMTDSEAYALLEDRRVRWESRAR